MAGRRGLKPMSHGALHTRTLMMLLWLTILPGAATAAPLLYGVSSGSPGVVYTVDPTTGAATFVTNISGGTTSLVGAEYLHGELWISDFFGASGRIGTVDLTTGAFSPVGSQAGSVNWHGLAADPDTATLYAIAMDQPGDPLYAMSTSGTTPLVGNTNIDAAGMAFDPVANVLYAIAGASLYTVNTADGTASLIGGLNVSTGGFTLGLAFSPTLNALFMNTNGLLYQVDVTTGAATLIGPNGVVRIDGLAAFDTEAPEPSTLVLFGLGLSGSAVLLRRRRPVRDLLRGSIKAARNDGNGHG